MPPYCNSCLVSCPVLVLRNQEQAALVSPRTSRRSSLVPDWQCGLQLTLLHGADGVHLDLLLKGLLDAGAGRNCELRLLVMVSVMLLSAALSTLNETRVALELRCALLSPCHALPLGEG